MKHTKKLLLLMTIAWILLLTVVFSHSWIARNWTPSISQPNITISSSSALLISLTEDSTDLQSTVSLNTVLNTEDFTLMQVSSSDGAIFHTVDFLPTLNQKSPVFTNENIENRYIDFTFYLKRQINNNPDAAMDKLVYIHPESHINSIVDGEDISRAIRIAITIDNSPPIILANCEEKDGGQYNGSRNTTASNSTANGLDVYDNYTSTESNLQYNTAATATQTAYGLYYYNGGRSAADFTDDNDPTNDYDFTPNASRALVRMATGQVCKVNLKIWLEGGDETCDEDIAGKVFDFLLKFDSVDIPIEQTTTTD